ncbi:MAG TPA: DUF4266 domain-containing protein [Polyangiaceae bacterium]|nr:DUF4266 domain-containing protein [Polyangiaceae bacterium]
MQKRSTSRSFWAICGSVAGAVAAASVAGGCATVRPEQRAILADPIMQFEGDQSESAGREHVLENREAAIGSGSIKGGGCGCN